MANRSLRQQNLKSLEGNYAYPTLSNSSKSYPVQLKQYSNIIPLDNDVKKLPSKLYKYMSLEAIGLSFIGEKGKQTLMFANPSTWKDPYEKIICKANFEGFYPPQVLACCMTRCLSSEAAWKTYKYEGTGLDGRCAKIVVNTRALLEELQKYAEAEGYNIYIGNVNYVKNSEIKELDKNYKKYEEEQEFTEKSFLKLMCLKRAAFFYEKEIRFFLIKKDANTLPNTKNQQDNKLCVPVDWNRVAEKIYIEDCCSIMEENFVKRIAFGKEVKKSRLYAPVKWKLNFRIK